MAYADDIAIISNSKLQLLAAINALEQWSSKNEININRKKSAIMQIKLDQRTPNTLPIELKGFPVVNHYKYLGIVIDNDTTLRHTAQ